MESIPHEHVNEILLVGRLAAEAVRRELPSGDEIVTFRLVVERGPQPARARASTAGSRVPTVDTLECTAWRKAAQRAVSRAEAGDVLEVRGALRRRFWRTPGGSASRSEVEAAAIRRVRSPASATAN